MQAVGKATIHRVPECRKIQRMGRLQQGAQSGTEARQSAEAATCQQISEDRTNFRRPYKCKIPLPNHLQWMRRLQKGAQGGREA